MAVPNSQPTQADLPRIAIDAARFLGLSPVGRIARTGHPVIRHQESVLAAAGHLRRALDQVRPAAAHGPPAAP